MATSIRSPRSYAVVTAITQYVECPYEICFIIASASRYYLYVAIHVDLYIPVHLYLVAVHVDLYVPVRVYLIAVHVDLYVPVPVYLY